ncbi:MAG: pantetheine-phosphate adenylyltransferase [Candidatus Omnitrophica bacterium CG07_land_8_20_14_0_80_42_15]|uniref:Phosphopantetheine adenylyltransferase n=1 Tax=Candidatus Aquitaenariimonas noxiae TaxID=1974741 RepID=A0A2J0L5Z5_9BACT|nr:MAG: pantetheine-phosphate adenylyltransferase [Candidatus Omnitrophica bacterium CG07_land_8_20_14_0_80_42_15]
MNGCVIYPGTFDPITNGHIDMIKRAAKVFDEVIVAIAYNPQKEPLLPFEDRIYLARKALAGIKNVKVDSFRGLVVDYVNSKKVKFILRGLRMISDFEYEFQMALTNRNLDKSIETIFMMPSEEYAYASSKLIKEAASLGANLRKFVSREVEMKIKDVLKKKGYEDAVAGKNKGKGAKKK